MIKKLGILLLALIAVVGLSSAASAQPLAGPGYGSTYGGHYMGGGHNTVIIINRHRHHFFPPFFRFHQRHHFMPFYGR